MMGSSPVVDPACWGEVGPILLNLTVPWGTGSSLAYSASNGLNLTMPGVWLFIGLHCQLPLNLTMASRAWRYTV